MKTKEERAAYMRAWRANNPDKLKAYADERQRVTPRRWNPDGPLSEREKNLRKKYGITEAQHDAMLSAQEGKCAICEEALDAPNVDHCHTTGKVRGLLCRHCNLGLGHFMDNTARLVRAAAYLENQ